MCSILGIINFNGLTKEDLEHFRYMFLKAESRGRDASGVATQNLNFLKWSKPTSEAKKTVEFNSFLGGAVGQKWIIGHARAATQGDPGDPINNHPITVAHDKFLLVHNGIVGSKGIVASEKRTDTYIIAKAIQQTWREDSLFMTTQKAYGLFYGSAAISVITPHEIVLARRDNPIVTGTLHDGAIVFGSTREIINAGKTGVVNNVDEMQQNSLVGYNTQGASQKGALPIVNRPYVFDDDWRSASGFDDEDDETEHDSEFESPYQTRMDRFLQSTRFYRKSGKGKGWWKDKERHRKAALLGYARKNRGQSVLNNLRLSEERSRRWWWG